MFQIILRPRKCATRPCATIQQLLFLIPDRFKTEEICIKVAEVDPLQLEHVPDHFKTQGMCDYVVWGDPFSLQYVPDWFVTQEQIELWDDDNDYCNDDKLIEWYEGYQKHTAQKAKIKDELLPIAWHPSQWWNWCVAEDEKKETEKFFLTI